MTTFTVPSLERRLLQTVSEEMTAEPVQEWPLSSIRLCHDLLRGVRESTISLRRALEDKLAEGVEARSFAAAYGPYLPAVEEQHTRVQELVKRLPPGVDSASDRFAVELRPLVDELRLLDQETRAFRDLLAEALARAVAPPRPIDWERVRAAEEAYARGETKRFSRR